MRIPRPLLVLAMAAVLALTACSSIDDSRALSVNGDELSVEAVEAELKAIQGNEQYRTIVEQGLADQGLAVSGEGEGTFDTAFVARLLSLGVYYELLEQEVTARGIPLTDAMLEQSRPQAVASVGGDPVFAAFPSSYQDQLVRRQALTRRIQELVAPAPTVEEVRAYYEEHRDDYTGACVSHIFANPEQRGEEAARQHIADLARQLDEGADFRVLAAEQSDDPATAAAAGSLGCGGSGRFIPDFEAAVATLPVGVVSDPVQTEAGFHLILVESRNTLPFEEVQPQVAQTLDEQRIDAFSTFVDELTCEAEVEVNPRYGSWTGTCDNPAEPGSVTPPVGPVPAPSSGDPALPVDPAGE